MHEERLVKNIVEQILSAAQHAEASQIHRIEIALSSSEEYNAEHLREHLVRNLFGTAGEHATITFTRATDSTIECSPIGIMLKNIEVSP